MPEPSIEQEQARMIAEIEQEAKATAHLTGRAEFNPRTMAAMAGIPRHEFVRSSEKDVAYVNAALPVNCGQTISQPYIVALMTDLLDVDKEAVVLDIGTGSGYQAAILAEIAKQVYSIEVIEPLALEAAERLRRLGHDNVEVLVGDGHEGCPQHAPFDGILVAAAGAEIPSALIDQLKSGARLVMPIQSRLGGQNLIVAEKQPSGHIHTRSVLPVAFVPFRRASDRQRASR